MTITKCDICGKEISLTDSKYRVLFDNKNWVEERDICVPCFERIEKELKANNKGLVINESLL